MELYGPAEKNLQAQKAKLMPENPVASGKCCHLDSLK